MSDDDCLLLPGHYTDSPQHGSLPFSLDKSEHKHVQHTQAGSCHHHIVTFDGGQLDGSARGDSEPVGGNFAEADFAFPQTLPGPSSRMLCELTAILVPLASTAADMANSSV